MGTARITRSRATDPNVGTVRIRRLPHADRLFPHRPTAPVPTCWLECGQLLTRHLDALLEGPVAHHLPLDLVDGVDDRRMVPPAERLPDLDELHAQHIAREIHRYLARNGERLRPGLGTQALAGHAPPPRHDL